MATVRPFTLFDTLQYNNINLDILTETVKYNIISINKQKYLFLFKNLV